LKPAIKESLGLRADALSEQHPREQGLKPIRTVKTKLRLQLSEQHPREQGLKQ